MSNYYGVFVAYLALVTLAQCTSYNDSLSPVDQVNLDASNNFQSQSGGLELTPNGSYLLRGQELMGTKTINSQPVYQNITVNGVEYTIISAKFEYGLAIYAVSARDKFADIGSDLDPIPANGLTATQFAGKYFERTMDANRVLSGEESGSIVLTLDMNTETLTSSLGPAIEYQWNTASNSFVGVSSTTGETLTYSGDLLLGHYARPNGADTDLGTFWALGE